MNRQRLEKNQQLGMDYGTASHKLLKDVLFALVVEAGKNTCFHCGGEICRETMSIEHKMPWLHSPQPLQLFFDLNNIAFSHLACNVRAARRPHKLATDKKMEVMAQRKFRKTKAGGRTYPAAARRARYLAEGR